MNDLRFAVRQLVKNPGFTTVAVLTLALCVGANVVIFSVVDSILLRALPFREPDRLVTTINCYPKAGVPRGSSSLPNYYDRRQLIAAFEKTADAYWRAHFNGDPNVIGRELRVDGLKAIVVGLLPPGFHYLSS